MNRALEAIDSAADWLCDAHPGSDQMERGLALRNAQKAYVALVAERDALRKSLQECVGYIEMTMAHRGTMNVAQIMEELKRVHYYSFVETSHSLGCPKTTRKVDLATARALLAAGGAK